MDLHVDGYNNFRKDRGSQGGGILLTISNDILCTHRPDLEIDDNNMINFVMNLWCV